MNDAAVRRAAETIREQLAAVGVRLVLEVIPALRRVLRPPQRAPAGVHLEVVLARAGRRDRRLHRDVGPGRRPELPALERRGSSTAPAAPGRSAATTTQLRAAARDIQLRAAECLPLIPLFAPAAVWAHHRRVRNWRPNRHDLYPLYGDVWLADGH